ncbi:hypothetical protein IQ260_09805 [Leptolyngbya cf. ectocarpi LEGE 11479]|uniref:ATP-binding protein n=1 Tax=Leptolyngbya cf. ectocarpi LEGE 11479 TaxID=1828722 RepID=A0A928X3J6_LEPEC|nr:hypothetical protein [Leptolyngbya ectocarpi]MBE9066949.1 hypothetical protein [Leptolyngbya cf. ectocarpi LEGE 11479]
MLCSRILQSHPKRYTATCHPLATPPMPKWFNTAGPCQADIHYMLPPTQRLPKLKRLIQQRGYFVIHAPRQTGKTTAMLALAQELTASGQYTAIMVSAEVGQPFNHDPTKAEAAMLDAWKDTAQFCLSSELQPPPWPVAATGRQIGAALTAWSVHCPRPLVIFVGAIFYSGCYRFGLYPDPRTTLASQCLSTAGGRRTCS